MSVALPIKDCGWCCTDQEPGHPLGQGTLSGYEESLESVIFLVRGTVWSPFGALAQLAELRTFNPSVQGSSPWRPTSTNVQIVPVFRDPLASPGASLER
jgi:hypothetical protein